MNFINLTPHKLNLHLNGVITTLESVGIARVGTTAGKELERWGDYPCLLFSAPSFGKIEGLPGPQEDTIYIVSGVVAAALAGSGRRDVFSPGTGPGDGAVRDVDGQIIGVTRLNRARDY